MNDIYFPKPDHGKQKRIVVYVPEEDFRRLRAKLALLGLTLSGWLRKVIKKFIEK